jgi:hypothetical protein
MERRDCGKRRENCLLIPCEFFMNENREAYQKIMDQAVKSELQELVDRPEFDLPHTRRDLSKPENIRWLVRNILIRNRHLISDMQFRALEDLAQRS